MNMRKIWILLLAGLVMVLADSAFAKGMPAETNLVSALTKAETGKKLLFVLYGREACGNCRALRSMIRERQVKLTEKDFVYADVDCDDPATQQEFRTKFKVEGNMLPFVVIADPTGKQLASRTGYANAADFMEFIKEAKRTYTLAQKVNPPLPDTSVPLKKQAADIPADYNREKRLWTSTSGSQVTAALVEQRSETIVLKKEDGTQVEVSKKLLSKADQGYLEKLHESLSTPGQAKKEP